MRQLLGFLAAALALQTCLPLPVTVTQTPACDPDCPSPPADTFRQAGITSKFALTYLKIVSGTFDFKAEPKVVTVLSEAVLDYRMRVYLRCITIKQQHFTIPQAAYLETLNYFALSKPTAKEFTDWQREHQFPAATPGDGTSEPPALLPTPPAEAQFQRLTFERGFVDAARFNPQDQAIVYGAAWKGNPIELFTTPSDGNDARPLGRAGTSLLAVSSTGEIALSRERRPAPDIDPSVGLGILARLPRGLDVPQDVATSVAFADFAPDGKDLAIVRQEGLEMRLEYPIGKVLYRTAGWIGNARVSPDGNRVAFLDYPTKSDRFGAVAVVDRLGRPTTLASGFLWQQGLAWSPKGDEVWFTAYQVGSPKALYAVSLAAKPRLRMVWPLWGEMTLHDIASDGRLLLAQDERRCEQWVRAPGAIADRDLSFLDCSFLVSISADGSRIVFNESGEAGGPNGGVYVARTDGSQQVRLSDAFPFDLSRDGRFVLEFNGYHGTASHAVVHPTGMGRTNPLPTAPLDYQIGGFFPDGRRILLVASEPQKPLRTYTQDVSGDKAARPITPEGFSATVPDTTAITPDGRFFVARDPEGRARLWPVEGGEGQLIPGFEAGEDAAMLFTEFTEARRTLLVGRFRELPMRIFRLDIITGRRDSEPWKTIAPRDRTGVETLSYVSFTPDLRAYGYTYVRRQGDLFLVKGLR
jgi:hypothetical protein